MATENKPKTADGYDSAQTLACERVLVTLLGAFGTLKSTIRLVGGLVPRYLTPESPPDVPAHAGTTDVDIVFNLQVIAADEGYASLADQLKSRGFVRYQKTGTKSPSSWQWERKVSENESVVVDFLHDAAYSAQEGRLISIEGESVSALGIRHAAVVHDWFREKRVTVELFDGAGMSTEEVRHADLTAFIILKAISFDQRGENKDAGDLIHVMRFAGTPAQIAEEIVARYNTGQHNEAIHDALDRLETRFCDGDGVEGYLRNGSVAAAMFQFGLDPGDEEDRVLAQRGIAGLVADIVARVRKRLVAEP
jgi:hypothetical protein